TPTPTPTPIYPFPKPYEPKPEPKDRKANTDTKDRVVDIIAKTEDPVEQKETKIIVPEPTLPVDFKDINGTSYEAAIRDLASRGILKGTGEGLFEPNLSITRSMVVELFYRLSRDKELTGHMNPHTDVKEDDWFYTSVLWATEKGIAKGTDQGTFLPEKLVTRQEMALFMERFLSFLQLQGEITKPFQYGDKNLIPEWSIQAVEAMDGYGLVTGHDAQIYGPETTISRGELAAILQRLIQLVK
ncbi:MAG: S-layer homology domain-containing protein, partial [Tissierellia bacterium]|nr:S-layer homology domain-containing protein [Tissierellia bacterium]